MTSYAQCIVFLLAKAYQKAHGRLRARLVPYGLTPIQSLILAALREEEGLSASDLGKRLLLDGATLSGVLERLIAADWVRKETDPNDKRIQRIFLSEKGKELQSQLIEERNKANDEVLAGLSLEEKILFKRLLRDVKG